MKKSKLLFGLVPVIMGLMVFFACNKSVENAELRIRMTDAPFNAQEVNIDLKEVRVNFDKDTSGWVTLNTNARVYNLLGLQNGVDTLIASAIIPGGTVKEIRLILGTNNTIKINNVVYPMAVSSADESGLKIKVDKKLRSTIETVLIDFDADLSIIQTGSNTYKLKPVIKLKN